MSQRRTVESAPRKRRWLNWIAEQSKIGEYGYELEVYECSRCCFHIGLDSTFLDQVGPRQITCPSCYETISTEEEAESAAERVMN